MKTDLLSTQAILNDIKETLPEYRGYTFNTFFNDVFNSDVYIIGTYKANANLMHYLGVQYDGPLAALHDAKLYLEQKMDTDSTISIRDLNPEKAASLIAYCIADFYIDTILNNTNLNIDDNINSKTITTFTKNLKQQSEMAWFNKIKTFYH